MYDTIGPSTQGAWVVDFFPGFGTGCPGTGGVVPTQWWSYGPPSPGNADFALRLDNARPNAPALFIFGMSSTVWGAQPLPLDLAIFGGNGCSMYSSVDFTSFVVTDANGRAFYPLPVPAGIQGTFWCQWGVFDGGAPNSIGLAATNGGKLIVW